MPFLTDWTFVKNDGTVTPNECFTKLGLIQLADHQNVNIFNIPIAEGGDMSATENFSSDTGGMNASQYPVDKLICLPELYYYSYRGSSFTPVDKTTPVTPDSRHRSFLFKVDGDITGEHPNVLVYFTESYDTESYDIYCKVFNSPIYLNHDSRFPIELIDKLSIELNGVTYIRCMDVIQSSFIGDVAGATRIKIHTPLINQSNPKKLQGYVYKLGKYDAHYDRYFSEIYGKMVPRRGIEYTPNIPLNIAAPFSLSDNQGFDWAFVKADVNSVGEIILPNDTLAPIVIIPLYYEDGDNTTPTLEIRSRLEIRRINVRGSLGGYAGVIRTFNNITELNTLLEDPDTQMPWIWFDTDIDKSRLIIEATYDLVTYIEKPLYVSDGDSDDDSDDDSFVPGSSRFDEIPDGKGFKYKLKASDSKPLADDITECYIESPIYTFKEIDYVPLKKVINNDVLVTILDDNNSDLIGRQDWMKVLDMIALYKSGVHKSLGMSLNEDGEIIILSHLVVQGLENMI